MYSMAAGTISNWQHAISNQYAANFGSGYDIKLQIPHLLTKFT
jgi:hypothetical protein